MKRLAVVSVVGVMMLAGCSSGRYSVEDIQKIVFETSSFDGSTYFEANLVTNMLRYAEPEGSGYGDKKDCELADNQLLALRNILEEVHVRDWKVSYPDPNDFVDGMMWSLTIYTENMTQESRGENTDPAPQNFHDFENGLRQIMKECAAQ